MKITTEDFEMLIKQEFENNSWKFDSAFSASSQEYDEGQIVGKTMVHYHHEHFWISLEIGDSCYEQTVCGEVIQNGGATIKIAKENIAKDLDLYIAQATKLRKMF